VAGAASDKVVLGLWRAVGAHPKGRPGAAERRERRGSAKWPEVASATLHFVLLAGTKNAMPKKVPAVSRKIGFVETMDCLPVSKLPEGAEWTYEIKLDGYRLEAVRNTKEVTLYSRR